MIVCVCHAVSDRTLRQLLRRGARDAEELACRTGAGSSCGTCRPAITRLVEEEAVRAGWEEAAAAK